MRRAGALVATVIAAGSACDAGATSSPATERPPPVVRFERLGTFDEPVDMAWRAGDDGLYVVERDGRVVRLAPDGSVRMVLDVVERTTSQGEQGLLGLTFDPGGSRAYINHTDRSGWTEILELDVAADGTFGGERVLLRAPQPSGHHNGGDLAFGPDGMLYLGLGDGSAAGDADAVALDPASLLGKILRIDPGAGEPYGVPADNPYVGDEAAAPEVWSIGLRNPWRFSFDRATGDLWIGDVGQDAREEVDVAVATDGRAAGRGVSFGWSALEGDQPFRTDAVADDDSAEPFYSYAHDEGCSVIGGVRARGPATGTMDGWYVFGDWCAGKVWALEVLDDPSPAPGRLVTLGDIGALVAVVEGPAGELYAISQHGPMFRLISA